MYSKISPRISFEKLLSPYVQNSALAGAVVAIADREQIISLEAVGYADIANRIPMQTDSLFWIASMTKGMTGVAVMMLADEGLLSLDDPAEKYLPDFRNAWLSVFAEPDCMLLRRPSKPMTIREMLCHTSGMPYGSIMEWPTLDSVPLKDLVRSYPLVPLHSHPGTAYCYSNMGINAAGRIIELVSGMTYEDFMETRIFQPLGMTDTTFWPDEEQLTRLAKSYRPNPAGDNLEEIDIFYLTRPYNNRTIRHAFPGGGLFSTATDILRFCRMMLGGGILEGVRYLSEPAYTQVISKQTDDTIQEAYGLGFSLTDDGFGHGGAMATNMRISTQIGLTMVYLVQHAGFALNGAEAQQTTWNAVVENLGPSKP